MTADLPSSVVRYIKERESSDAQALVAVFDQYGHYLYVSLNHQEAIGYTERELLTMHLSQVVDQPEHHAAWVLRTIAVFYSKPITFSSRLVAKAGHIVPVKGTLLHIREPQSTMYFITCVTVHKKMPGAGHDRREGI